MKAFVIATLFVASCAASHYGAISTQFQAQDGHGGYSYGYSDPLSSKQETKSHDGSVHGGYSYVDAHGHVQSVKYVADPHHGFQIVSATNLPKGPEAHPVAAYHAAPAHYAPAVSHWGHHAYAPLAHGLPQPVQKTHEVLVAEQAHFAAVAEAKARVHHHYKRSIYEYAPAPVNGVPVDTAEVAHAKAAHFALVAEAKSKVAYGGHNDHYNDYNGHYSAPAPAHNYYSAPAYNHYAHQPAPAPVNGVPVDTAEVAHAKAKHFALVAEAKSKVAYGGHNDHYNHAPAYHQAPASYHYPIISNGVPEDTYEVKAAKAKHFAAVHEAQAKASYAPSHYGHEDDGSYDAKRYENDHYYH